MREPVHLSDLLAKARDEFLMRSSKSRIYSVFTRDDTITVRISTGAGPHYRYVERTCTATEARHFLGGNLIIEMADMLEAQVL